MLFLVTALAEPPPSLTITELVEQADLIVVATAHTSELHGLKPGDRHTTEGEPWVEYIVETVLEGAPVERVRVRATQWCEPGPHVYELRQGQVVDLTGGSPREVVPDAWILDPTTKTPARVVLPLRRTDAGFGTVNFIQPATDDRIRAIREEVAKPGASRRIHW